MPQMRVSATKYACCCRTVGHRHRPSLGPNALAYQRHGSRAKAGADRACRLALSVLTVTAR
jgi:hypothetical protein